MDPRHPSSISSERDPPVKVVGFHVEGATPSPSSTPGELRRSLEKGSISPVIIPPTFQGQRTPDVSPKRRIEQSVVVEASASAPAESIGPSQEVLKRSPFDNSSAVAAHAPPSAATAPVSAGLDGTKPTKSMQERELAEISQTRRRSEEQRRALSPRSLAKGNDEEQQQAKAGPLEQAAKIDVSPRRIQNEERSTAKQYPMSKQKQMTKAERRALQEAQRAAKASAKAAQESGRSKGSKEALVRGDVVASEQGEPSQNSTEQENRRRRGVQAEADAQQSVGLTESHGKGREDRERLTGVHKPTELFAHLPQYRKIDLNNVAQKASKASLPAQCVQLGLRMADGSLRGANVRSLAFLEMLSEVIQDYAVVPGGSFAREFSPLLNAMVAYIVSCRPLNPALGNVIKAVKAELGRLNQDMSLTESKAQESLCTFIDNFMQEKFNFAQVTLARRGAGQLQDGDVILTYGYSTAVEAVIQLSVTSGTRVSVIVVDSRPLFEGRIMLRRLLANGIACEYLLLNSIEIGLNRATKVAVGAAGVMSNGAVLSRVGTAAVCMAAAGAHIPVMVCAESYKFAERVQLESVTFNELGDPMALLSGDDADVSRQLNEEWAQNDNLSMLNLVYDATPAEFVSVIVTEIGALPPTSVPAVLREYRTEQQQRQ